MCKLKASEQYIICGGQSTDTYPDITLPDITVIAPEPDPGDFPDGPSPTDPDGGNGEPEHEPNPLCVNPSRNVDHAFISTSEGQQRLNGYWPGGASSGVTVATGIDLGGRTEQSMANFGWPVDLISQLLPYTGRTGQEANNFLSANPLTVSQANADLMDSSVLSNVMSQVATNFDNAATFANFDQLPSGTQTAIVDLAYQYGTNLAVATPNFWVQITTGNWQAALNNLNNFGDAYHERRAREATLLQNDINTHRMPSDADPC